MPGIYYIIWNTEFQINGGIMAMTELLCPLCKNILVRYEKSFKCGKGHCFDISRKGTVNLLVSNKPRHGDDKRMVKARKAFLDKGYYAPLRGSVSRLVRENAFDSCTILDCGCGECYYTADIGKSLSDSGISSDIIGIDVSNEAIMCGASRHAGIRLVTASVFDIPLAPKSCDMVIALFSPFSGDEYLRVLKDGGIYITAFPLEDHLYELKQAVYDTPYKNKPSSLYVSGFALDKYEECTFKAELTSNEDVISLFEMTPYCYKTSVTDRAKLDSVESLTVSAEFGIAVYRKISS